MQKDISAEPDPAKKLKMYKEWLASRANPPPENTNTMTLEDFKIGFDSSATKAKKEKSTGEKAKEDILSRQKVEKKEMP